LTITYQDSKRISGLSYDIAQTPTLNDDFTSYATQGAADAVWVSNDTTKIRVNITNDNIDFNFTTNNSMKNIYYDLTSVSDSNWRLRFTIKFTTITGAANSYMYIGISDGATTDVNSSQDFIGVGFHTNTNKYFGDNFDNSLISNNQGGSNFVSFTPSTGTVYYFEVERLSSTSYIVRRYSDSSYSTVSDNTGGITCTSTTQTLRYLRIISPNDANTGTNLGVVDDVKFWSGTTTSKPTKALPLTGCKAYYNFEQTSGNLTNIATTANGFTDGLSSVDGTPVGSPTQNSTGKIGSYSWTFNGSSQYVNVSNITLPAYNTNNQFTFSMWVYANSVAAFPNHYPRIFHYYDGTKQWQLYIQSNNSKLAFDDTTNGMSASTQTISTGVWTHVVIVKTGNNTYKLYQNGVDLAQAAAPTGNTVPTTQTFRIGADITGTGADGYFNGKIDDFAYWDRALSASEVTTLYNSGSGLALNTQTAPETNSIAVETDKGTRHWFDGNNWFSTPSGVNTGISMGGTTAVWTTPSAVTEKYSNGVWTSATAMPAARQRCNGGGNSSGAIVYGGDTSGTTSTQTTTYLFGGSSWSTTGALNQKIQATCGSGNSTTNCMAIGGEVPEGSPTRLTTVQNFTGSTWSTLNSLSTARGSSGGSGNSYDAWTSCGLGISATLSSTEIYNGSTWSSGTAFSSATENIVGGVGRSYAGVFVGGYNGSAYQTATNYLNGTTWTNLGAMVTGVSYASIGGNKNSLLMATPYNGGWYTTTTYLWNGTTWATTGSLNTGRTTGATGAS